MYVYRVDWNYTQLCSLFDHGCYRHENEHCNQHHQESNRNITLDTPYVGEKMLFKLGGPKLSLLV